MYNRFIVNYIINMYIVQNKIIKMALQDETFLLSGAILYTTSIKNCGRSESLETSIS